MTTKTGVLAVEEANQLRALALRQTAHRLRLADAARIGWTNFWIPIASALLIYIIGVNPIYVLVAAGMGGYLYGLLVKPTE